MNPNSYDNIFMAVNIQYFGHSAVCITSDSGKKIWIDPWLDGNPSCPKALSNPTAADIIVLTHGHSDHVGSALALAKRSGAKVVATWELANLLVKDGLEASQIEFMNKGGNVQVDCGGTNIGVSLTQAFHSSSYDASDGKTYYAGEACGAVVHLETGECIYHAGDTALFSDMQLIAKRFAPKIALLPIGDRFTMGPEDAAEAARLIKPQIAIPIHWGTFDLLSGRPEAFLAAVSKCAPDVKVKVLRPGESLVP